MNIICIIESNNRVEFSTVENRNVNNYKIKTETFIILLFYWVR